MVDTVNRQHVLSTAQSMMRSKARTFYLASLFLPAPCRRDVQIVYSYFRLVDDLVDEPGSGIDRSHVLKCLSDWEKGLQTHAPSDNPLLGQILRVVDRYDIDPAHLQMILQGARFDLDMDTIETFEELKHYAVLVAGSVGMVMAPILGDRNRRGQEAACDLGVAMQLTNILRDVQEDVLRGRLYLPTTELRASGCSPDTVRAGVTTEALKMVVRHMVQETRGLYKKGMDGLIHLDPSSRFATCLAARLYEQILDKIEQRDFDVFSGRAHLGRLEKWRAAIPVYLEHRLVRQ